MLTNTDDEGLRKRKDSLSDEFDSELDENEMKEIVKDIEQDKLQEQQQPDTFGRRVCTCLKEWGQMATFHGIPHIACGHTLIAIIFWAIVVICCTIGIIYLSTTILKQYLQFNVVVNMHAGFVSDQFPSLTFCNTNPYKLSRISNVSELAALLTVYRAALDGTLT